MINSVILIGRLGKDPDIRYIEKTDRYVTRFSLAVDRDYKTQGGDKVTDWFNISVWGKMAETLANNMTKGRLVAVKGSIYNNNYKDDKGVMRYGYDIRAEGVQFLDYKDSKKHSSSGGQLEKDDLPDGYSALSENDNVPF